MNEATYEAIRAAQNGNETALEMLTKENAPLIRSIAMRFHGRGAEDEDLFQIGAIGFIKAVRAFDLERGLALSTYAVPMIMGEVRRHLRDNGLIKVSRSMRELAAKAASAAHTLSEKTDGEIPLSAISDYLGIPVEEIAAALEAVQTPDSLQRPIGDGDGLLMDALTGTEDIAEKAADRVTIQRLLDTGNAVEKNVIICRYFKDKTQSETAKLLGLTQVQVSRAEKKAIARLRQFMTPKTAENH